MSTLLTIDLTTKTAQLGEEPWAPPGWVFGETPTLGLRLQRTVEGVVTEPELDVVRVRAMIGLVDARPESGKWALQIGAGPQTASNTTEALQHGCAPSALAAAINGKAAVVAAYGNAAVSFEDGSWRLVFGAGTQEVPLRVVSNSLFPLSAGLVSAFGIDGLWTHEIRLVQAPVATVGAGGSGEPAVQRVLPPPPVITTIFAGGLSNGEPVNEVQSLRVPPEFRGGYVIKKGAVRTRELTGEDGAPQLQEALQGLLGKGNVKVTDASDFSARIEFIGRLAGKEQGQLTVEVVDVPQGDLTFALRLDRAPLAVLLKRRAVAELPLDVLLTIEAEDGTRSEELAFRQMVTIARPVIWPSMDAVEQLDWLEPLSPKDYRLFDPSTVITGQQFYPDAVGDGVATSFAIAHNLNTLIVQVWVTENTTNGLQLVEGIDYRVRITNANTVTVTSLGGAVSTNGWLVVVMSAQTVAAFANGLTIEQAQVNGLLARLESIEARLGAIEDLAGSVPRGTSDPDAATGEIQIPERTEIFHGGRWIGGRPAPAMRAGLLPVAVHDATATAILALPGVPASSAGSVFQSENDIAFEIPGGGGRRRATLEPGGYVASDGISWYPVERSGATSSYFPKALERTLFAIVVSAEQFRAGGLCTVEFSLEAWIAAANTAAQCVLAIEVGTLVSQATPATTAPNLQAITWATATPVLSQLVRLTEVPQTNQFGCSFARSEDGATIAATKLSYGLWQGGTPPASATFALRARLLQWDTENMLPPSVRRPRGIPAYALKAASATIQNV